MIRDQVILVEILERAGQQIVEREEREGRVERLYGFAWITVRNVAISMLRRSPYLFEQPIVGSPEGAVVLSRLSAEESSPASIESDVLCSQVLSRLSSRERMIAIWKRSGFSSREIAQRLGMSVSAVDTTHCRTRQKVRTILRSKPGRD